MKSLVFHHGGEILEIPKVTGVAWFPDGKSLVVGTIGREQDHPDLGCWWHFCEVFGNQWVRIVTESQSEWQISCFQYLEWGCFEKGLLPQAVGSQYWYELEGICPVSHKYFFNAIAYSRDGKLVASGDNYVQNNLRVWDVASGSLLHTLAGHQPATNAKPLSPLGGQLVSGGPDSLVIVWDLSTSVPSPTLKGHKQHVMSVVYTPDGQRIASGAADGSIRWWEASTGLCLKNVSVTDTSGPIGSSFASWPSALMRPQFSLAAMWAPRECGIIASGQLVSVTAGLGCQWHTAQMGNIWLQAAMVPWHLPSSMHFWISMPQKGRRKAPAIPTWNPMWRWLCSVVLWLLMIAV